jgi:hypothetical protein
MRPAKIRFAGNNEYNNAETIGEYKLQCTACLVNKKNARDTTNTNEDIRYNFFATFETKQSILESKIIRPQFKRMFIELLQSTKSIDIQTWEEWSQYGIMTVLFHLKPNFDILYIWDILKKEIYPLQTCVEEKYS